MVRLSDLIGRYWKMVRRKDLIGLYGKMVRPKDLIGRYEKMVHRRALIVRYGIWSVEQLWLVCTTCWSCQSNLIGRSDLFSSENALWLDDPEICLLAPSMDFLFRKFIQSFTNNKKTICEMCLVLRQIRRSICRCARNRQNDHHLCYYLLYPWWSFKTVHYACRWSSVSVMM